MSVAVRSKLSKLSGTDKEVLLETKAERIEMTLNTENSIASGLLIQRLTELYEDPVEATVRETVSNALDAVTESYSGELPKVEIVTPTELSPVFTVKDNGVGMSYKDLKEIYSKYGSSTKADDLEQIGAYGLGAKSPLAYGNEFTVTSIKNGEKTTIIVAREEITNYIKIVDSRKTSEPSGTTVSVSVNDNDIHRFELSVSKYLTNPVDKEVSLYVNSQPVKGDDYVEISNNVLLMDGKEKVYGRVWVEKSDVIKLLTDLPQSSIAGCLKLLIGGWAYNSPARRNRRNNYSQRRYGIVVELKAGIVDFNSSRDAILENDRYQKLEDLIVEYVESERFTKDLIKATNSLDITNFKKALGELLHNQNYYIKVAGNKVEVDIKERFSKYSNVIARTFETKDFVHNETGFNFNTLLEDTPKQTKPTFVVAERKAYFHKVAQTYIMRDFTKDQPSFFEGVTITDMNKVFQEVMDGNKNSSVLGALMLYLLQECFYKNSLKEKAVVCVTDIETEHHVKQLRTNRKAMMERIDTKGKGEGYEKIIIYTKHTKADIEKMFEKAGFKDINLEIEKVDKVLELAKKIRLENRKKRKVAKTKRGLSTRLLKLSNECLLRTDLNMLDDIDKSMKNITVVTKRGYIDVTHLEMMRIWYCNQNELLESEVDLYLSIGTHTIKDIELLLDIGEVFRDPNTNSVGNSKMYYEKIHNNVIGTDIINENSEKVREEAINCILTEAFCCRSESVSSEIKERLDKAYQIADLANIELPKMPENFLKFINNRSGAPSSYSDSGVVRWINEGTTFQPLLKFLNREDFELISDLTTLASRVRLEMKSEKDIRVVHPNMIVEIDTCDVEKAYKSKDLSTSSTKLVKAQTEAYLDFVKELINKMSLAC